MDAVAIPASVALRSHTADATAETHCFADLRALDAALDEGLRHEWTRLIAADPLASVYQSPGWCVPWYHCYSDAYTPWLVVVRDAGLLVGLVPMAVEKKSGRLVFASDTMADYRDIVARPGYRELVIAELVKRYLDGRFEGPLCIGWLDPASDTPAIAAAVSRGLGVKHAAQYQPCWRWFPQPGENLQKKFSRVRTHLNHFKRQGDVTFDVITHPSEWAAFRDEFVQQHSLRQLQAGREVSFDDPRKRQLYDTLFADREVQLHVTACRVNGRMIAGHVGLVWRDVLLFGAPSISLEDEHRSPAVILMTWILQNASQLGLAGLDLTIGESEFKRRLSNRCVGLTMVEIYGRDRDYYVDRARANAVRWSRRAAERLLGDDGWEKRVKPAAAAARYKWQRFGELGPRAAVAKAASHVLGQPAKEITYSVAPDALTSAREGRPAEMHQNRVEDLLLWNGRSPGTAAALNACARSYARNRAAGHALHTLVADGRLLAWCYTDQLSIHGIGGAAEWDEGTYETLIRSVAGARFGEGATAVRVMVPESARPLRRALGRLGFRIAAPD